MPIIKFHAGWLYCVTSSILIEILIDIFKNLFIAHVKLSQFVTQHIEHVTGIVVLMNALTISVCAVWLHSMAPSTILPNTMSTLSLCIGFKPKS